ncbi:hypothetical protein [Patulibacter minatonensis]|uniref:hypothetical protein n=1 Tax=Patulibacter minatonensis TaxID=298163 RepID=UPI00047ABCA8|nr:hypothetical protein [Patulibacter minatonensis]
MYRPSTRLRRPRSSIVGAALLISLLGASPAVAEPLTITNPNGPSKVTIDRREAAPGERIRITGEGFPVTVNVTGPGNPVVAVRPYSFDSGPAWAGSGADYLPACGAGPVTPACAPAILTDEAAHWFQTKADSPADPDVVGFTGFMQVPQTATIDGPTPALKGQHWFQILSGAPFTSTGGDSAGRKVQELVYSYQVPFKIVANLTLGLQQGAFHEGTTFRPGALVTVKGRGFAPSTAVTATVTTPSGTAPVAVTTTVDSTPTATTTDTDGAFPDATRFTLPAGTPTGPATLRFTTGSVSYEASITVTPAPTATLRTPVIRPGGLLAFDAENFIGVKGTGQKIAIVVKVPATGGGAPVEKVIGCFSADAQGRASGAVTAPADVVTTPPGDVVPTEGVRFNAGLSCVLPAGGPPVVNDAPGASVGPKALTVSATAPAVTAPATGTAGSTLALSGEGFGPSAPVSVTYRGVAVPITASTDAQGAFSGTIAVPEATGDGVLLVTAGTRSAASFVTVTARPADPVPTVPDTPTLTIVQPDPTGPPTTPTTPTKPTVVAGRAHSLKSRPGNRKVRLVVKGGTAGSTAVTIRSKAKVRLGSKKKATIVVLAKRTLTKAGTYDLTLTKDGRALLKRSKRVKVVVTIAPKGGKAVTRTLTLKRA